jgi:hypothetical protein
VDEHTFPYRVYDCVLANNGVPYQPGARGAAPGSESEIPDFKSGAGGPPRAPGQNGDTWVINDKPARLVRYDQNACRNAPFRLVVSDVVNPGYPIRHDSRKLARALMEILKEG